MAIGSEVLVIGGGLAGSTAALSAANAGADVRLVTAAESTLTGASGLIDVLGYTYEGGELADEPLADPFAGVDALHEDHPYRVLGTGAIRDGLATFEDAVGSTYAGDHTDRNALVPTPVGSIKPTARYPRSVRPGLVSRRGETLVVGFEGIPDFDAEVVAERLASLGVPFSVDAATVPFPGEFPADASIGRHAAALDRDDEVPASDGPTTETTTRAALAERIRRHVDGHDRVGVPAVLGTDDHQAVRDDLVERLGVGVFEVPTAPPSMPGIRLSNRLEAAVRDAGVHVDVANPVVDVVTEDGRVEGVLVDREGQRIPYEAEAYVLATGGLVGKGIDSDREGVREPLFDCHVPHPEDRRDWYRDGPFEDHPFARFGVVIDDRARPLGADGEPEYRNLRAAGGVVGGADVAREKSASGVSLATGVVAGRDAATEVTE